MRDTKSSQASTWDEGAQKRWKKKVDGASFPMVQPVPKNLRELMLKRVSSMDEKALQRLYALDLLQEKISLREEMSRQAEAEQTAGQWNGLAAAVHAYRSMDRLTHPPE